MTIQEMLDRVKSLDLKTSIPQIIEQTSYEIEVLNKQQLYNHGVDSDSNKLSKYQNKYYAKEKGYDNPRPGLGVPDLFLTGAFYKGFSVSVTNDTIEIDSSDVKSDKLKKQYGEEIFGLTKDNIKVYALGVFYQALQKYVNLKLG